MFELKNVPCYLDGMKTKKVKVGRDKEKGTQMSLRVDLTPELAAELGDAKRLLYRMNDGTPNKDLKAGQLTYTPKPQRIEIRPDPVLAKASVTILEAKVTPLKFNRENDSTQWVGTFNVEFIAIDPVDLLYLRDAMFEQRFFTFEPSEMGLFDEAEKAERRESKDAKPVRGARGGGEARAH